MQHIPQTLRIPVPTILDFVIFAFSLEKYEKNEKS